MGNKVQEKRIIQFEATRKWIEDYGNQKYASKTRVRTTIILSVGLALSAIISIITKNTALFWIPTSFVLAYMCYWFIKGMQEGRKFWNEIKDKEQPIKLKD